MTEITQADRDAAIECLGYNDGRTLLPLEKRRIDLTSEAFARHRMKERAAIVAWLRGPESYPDGYDIAADIEAGEHLK